MTNLDLTEHIELLQDYKRAIDDAQARWNRWNQGISEQLEKALSERVAALKTATGIELQIHVSDRSPTIQLGFKNSFGYRPEDGERVVQSGPYVLIGPDDNGLIRFLFVSASLQDERGKAAILGWEDPTQALEKLDLYFTELLKRARDEHWSRVGAVHRGK